jgi:hypothetical protein
MMFFWIGLCAATVFFTVVAIKYFVAPPDQLPSFLPGSLQHTSGFIRYKVHHSTQPLRTHAIGALALAAVSLFGVFRLRSQLLWG